MATVTTAKVKLFFVLLRFIYVWISSVTRYIL